MPPVPPCGSQCVLPSIRLVGAAYDPSLRSHCFMRRLACGGLGFLTASLGVMKKIFLAFLIAFLALLAAPGIHLMENSWMLLVANGYSIPKGSSALFFSCTSVSSGSGEYCNFGEDRSAFYGMCAPSKDTALPQCGGDYGRITRDQAAKCSAFSPHDARTWCATEKPANHSSPKAGA